MHSFGRFNRLPPRDEHIKAVMSALEQHNFLSIMEIVKISKLTKTQVECVLARLQSSEKLLVETSPKIRVSLRKQ